MEATELWVESAMFLTPDLDDDPAELLRWLDEEVIRKRPNLAAVIIRRRGEI